MSANRPRDVVFHLQIALSVVTGGAVVVDGLLGAQTYDAYHELPVQLRQVVHDLYVEPSPFLRDRLRSRPRENDGFVVYPRSSVNDTIPKVASRLDVPSSYLRLMVDEENWVSRSDVKTSVVGSFRGISQFNVETWTTIDDRYPELRLSSFEDGTQSIEESLLAAAALYRENLSVFQRAFPTKVYSDAIAYLFHQQGASGAIQYLRSGELVFPEQSSSSVALFDRARSEFS